MYIYSFFLIPGLSVSCLVVVPTFDVKKVVSSRLYMSCHFLEWMMLQQQQPRLCTPPTTEVMTVIMPTTPTTMTAYVVFRGNGGSCVQIKMPKKEGG